MSDQKPTIEEQIAILRQHAAVFENVIANLCRIAELEAELARERARADAEREQCCRDVCVSCRSGWMPERSREWDGLWSHGCLPCAAQAIRERHYQAQLAERKEGNEAVKERCLSTTAS